ncbi:FAD-binding oxidoreductase [Pseudonocardia spinosispora]|uniref:FAD-binding oxidoreductase n=1 Tax=Pseudonocardia spinosispora TaxID=103441 RepID=UPI00041A682E|nr:FAD-binding oxidoreductase [Pseudonocardia spinosispora]
MTVHQAAAADLRARYARVPEGQRVRLAKPTSNLFRFRSDGARIARLDVGALDQVLEVDPVARTAKVQGMTTYERFVDATLAHGLMPMVVPQLKTITVGGALAGLGIESSSFANGLAHESVIEIEVLTGDGRLITATRDNEHADLFRGLPNSYGTLGYAVSLTVELQPVKRYVALRHLPFPDAASCAEAIATICRDGSYEGTPIDFIDGTVFDAGEQYLTLGRFTDEAPGGRAASDYTGQQIYYRSIQRLREDVLTTRDYIWRWDTDWFWCSRALGAQHPVIRRLWPDRYRRSDVYRKLVALDRRRGFSGRVRGWQGLPPEEPVIQDIEVPVERLAEFLDAFHRDIGISPVWLCPVKLREPSGWPLYPMEPDRLYVNVGFWSAVALGEGQPMGTHNRRIEELVADLDGHKSLYSDSYYTVEEFWQNYNGPAYTELKKSYDPGGRLPDLYDKCVRER